MFGRDITYEVKYMVYNDDIKCDHTSFTAYFKNGGIYSKKIAIAHKEALEDLGYKNVRVYKITTKKKRIA